MAAKITILHFASIRTSLPGEPDSQQLALPPSTSAFTLSDFRTYLVENIHAGNDEFAGVLAKSAWSVNEEMVDREDETKTVLKAGDVVCPIPPVSGG